MRATQHLLTALHRKICLRVVAQIGCFPWEICRQSDAHHVALGGVGNGVDQRACRRFVVMRNRIVGRGVPRLGRRVSATCDKKE